MTMIDATHNDAPIGWTDDGDLETLTFDLRGETFAVEAVLVREILDLHAITPIPGAPALVSGVFNFRGKIIPYADLGLAFGMEMAADSANSRIVVIELSLGGEPCFIGLRTDNVHEVATLRREASEAAPAVGMRWRRDYVRRLIRRERDVVILPDLGAIFEPIAGGASLPTVH